MFYLSERSKGKLHDVHPDWGMIAGVAIVSTPIDFAITDGVRSLSQQEALVRAGASKTLESKHRRHTEEGTLCGEGEAGYGWALDLVSYIDGRACWEMEPTLELARQIRSASIDLRIPLRWGGVWDRPLGELSSDLEQEVQDYAERLGRAPFFDGPHFEKIPA